MCDYISGELILCFPKTDPAAQQLVEEIRHGLIEHVSYIESLEQKLARLGLKPDDDLKFEFHRVRTPMGEELWKVNYLQFFYKIKFLEVLTKGHPSPEFSASIGRSDHQFTVTPNSLLSLAAKPLGKETVRVTNFTFSDFHALYKAVVGIPAAPPPDLGQITIAIV